MSLLCCFEAKLLCTPMVTLAEILEGGGGGGCGGELKSPKLHCGCHDRHKY